MGVYKTKYLEEEWRVKLNVGQEWIKASFMDGNTEIWFKNEGEYKGQITEQQFIKSPIAKVLSKGHKETYTQTSVARVDGTQKNIIHSACLEWGSVPLERNNHI